MPEMQGFDSGKILAALRRAELLRYAFGPTLLGLVTAVITYLAANGIYAGYQKTYQALLPQHETFFCTLACLVGLLVGLLHERKLSSYRLNLRARAGAAGLVEKLAMDTEWLAEINDQEPRLLSGFWFGKPSGDITQCFLKLAVFLEWYVIRSGRDRLVAWGVCLAIPIVFISWALVVTAMVAVYTGMIFRYPQLMFFVSGTSPEATAFFIFRMVILLILTATMIDYAAGQRIAIGIVRSMVRARLG